MAKKIVCITGCRSEYDILYPVLKRLDSDKYFELSLIVAGAHLSERFGLTVRDIERDGFKIAGRIHSLIDSDMTIGKAKSSAMLMLGLSDALDRSHPDLTMVAGDREEAITTAMVSTFLGIPLVHLCGGDRTSPKAGDMDEPIRHATSKLAAMHFTMNKTHSQRLIRMGEEPWRVQTSGDPALDRFAEIKGMAKREILRYFGFNAPGNHTRPLIFLLQHVISGEAAHGGRHMKTILEALVPLNANLIINYPNSDIGSRDIIKTIESYRSCANVRVTRNIPRKEFVNLLRTIDLLVGNSSMALLEGAFLRIPAINIGNRNNNRMNGGNVIFVDVHTGKIRRTAEKILRDKRLRTKLKACSSAYGDGKAAERIVGFLKKMKYTKTELLAKDITY